MLLTSTVVLENMKNVHQVLENRSENTNPDYVLINDQDTSALLKIGPGTLAVWRSTKRYNLPYVKIGRKVMYRLSDVYRFIDQRTSSAQE